MIEKKSLVDQIYSHIVTGIQNREYKPGDRLVIEELTKKLGVSRTPIREAIGKLAQDGFVYMQHNVGPRIVEYNKKQISDINDTNGLLFRGVMKRVIDEGNIDALVLELNGIVEAQEKSLNENDDENYHKNSVDFHKAIIRACPNEKLSQVALQTQIQLDIFVVWYFQDEELKKTSVRDHKRLFKLLKDKKYDKFQEEFDNHNKKAWEYFNNINEEIE
jgi:DNA-binding GntR family transcriptional regulator